MKRVWQLKPLEILALFQAFVLVALVRVALKFCSFSAVLDFVERTSSEARLKRGEHLERQERKIWAIRAVGKRLLPKRPCLTQALVAYWMLRRMGRPAKLRIGVRRGTGELEAHAWLEQNGEMLIGHEGGYNYNPFPTLLGEEEGQDA